MRWPILLSSFLLLLPGLASARGGGESPDSKVQNAWVQVVPPDRGVVRVITEASKCPKVRFDGRPVRMNVRAEANPDYPVLVCEQSIPKRVRDVEVAGRHLKNVVREPRRIAIVGDTGCRMKDGDALDDGFQNCDDSDDWEFAKVAQQVADWEPDLIIQLGDYIYREQKCPDGCGNCTPDSFFNSPGMRMDTWNVEFFKPGTPMLEAAPLVLVRGDHEKCDRAGGGYFHFLDPFEARQCTDFSDPYALAFHGLDLVVMDTVQADDKSDSPDVVIERYANDFDAAAKLAKPGAWLLSHRPIWALRPAQKAVTEKDECDNQKIPDELIVEDINVTVQEALAESNLDGVLPPNIDLVLTAHIHVGEVLSFTGGRPSQMVVGISGTKLLPAVTDGLIGIEIDGETVTEALMISEHGFFGAQPHGHRDWWVDVLDVDGGVPAFCFLDGKQADCEGP